MDPTPIETGEIPHESPLRFKYCNKVTNFHPILEGLQRNDEVTPHRMRAGFAGPLGNKNVNTPFKYPSQGEFRRWSIPGSQLSFYEVNNGDKKMLVVGNDKDQSGIVIEPPSLQIGNTMRASNNGTLEYSITELINGIKTGDLDALAFGITAAIHEDSHLEDSENQDPTKLREMIDSLIGGTDQSAVNSATHDLLEYAVITPDEVTGLVNILQSLDDDRLISYHAGNSPKEETARTIVKNRIIEILIERRNFLVTNAAIRKIFGSEHNFDRLLGLEPNGSHIMQQKWLNTRRSVIEETQYPDEAVRIIQTTLRDTQYPSPLHNPHVPGGYVKRPEVEIPYHQ